MQPKLKVHLFSIFTHFRIVEIKADEKDAKELNF